MSKPLLIGLTGRKQSGKSTVASVLVSEHGFAECSFAAPIRKFTANLLDLTLSELEAEKEEPIHWLDNKVTPRQIMQRMGTEFGRQMVHPDVWVRHCLNEVTNYARRRVPVVISDVRFENESRAIRQAGGFIIHVQRSDLGVQTDMHVSETPLPMLFGDRVISNNGTVDDLADAVLNHLVQIHAQRAGQGEMALQQPGDRL